MVDAELATLAPHPRLGRHPPVVEPLELPVHLGQHQASDVVKKRRDRQLVALRKARQLSDPVGGKTGGHRVAPEALVALCPSSWANQAGRRFRSTRRPLARRWAERLDRLPHPAGAALGAGAVAGRAHDGDRQSDVGLDRLGQLARRRDLVLGRREGGAGATRPAPAGARRRRTPRQDGGRPVPHRALLLAPAWTPHRSLFARLGFRLGRRGVSGMRSRQPSATLARASAAPADVAAWWLPEAWVSLPAFMIGKAEAHV